MVVVVLVGGWWCVWVGERGGGGSFSLNLRVVHTLSVRSLLKTWPQKKIAKLVVGNDSGMCQGCFQ